MALTVATNTGALMAQAAASSVNKDMQTSMERLSTGNRINSAADDAAGVAITSRMTAEIKGLNQAIRNAADGVSMVDTAEGAMIEIESMLQRMRELSVQAASDTNNSNDRANLDQEVDQLLAEIDAITKRTSFNNINLLDGSLDTSLQIGSGTSASETLSFTVNAMSTSALGTTLSSMAAAGATSNDAQGVAAIETVAQIAFNGNDTYGMVLTLGNGAGGTETITLANSNVVGNAATDVLADFNTALNAEVARSGTTLNAGNISASVSGNVLTITNHLGDSVAASSFTSSANGTASYTSISGAGASKLLDDTAAVATVSNSGGGASSTASATLALAANKDYNFKVNGTDIAVTNYTGTGGTTQAALLAAVKLAIGDGGATSAATSGSATNLDLKDTTGNEIEITNFVAASSVAGAAGSMAMTVRVDTATPNTASNTFANNGSDTSDIETGDIVQLTFSETEADYTFKIDGAAGTKTYTVATASAGKTLAEAMAITRDAINADTATEKVVARVVDGKLELENTHTAAVTLDTFSSTGKAAVAAGAATFNSVNLTSIGSAATTNGAVATASEMSMTFSEDDDYSFKIGGTQITGQVDGSDLSGMIAAVNSNSGTTGVTASEVDGDMLLTHAAGGAIAITAMTSTGSGQIFAANASGQGSSAILDDTAAVTGAATAAAGKATATTMDLTMDASDKVSFHISDGRTNAVVRLTQFDPANNAAMLAEINTALTNAGSDITVAAGADTAGSTAGTADEKLVLTNSKGGVINLTNFTSDSTGVMTTSPGANQGVGKMLTDDGVTGSQAAISSVDINTSAGATSAIGAIDRALEQVSSERSKLGAIANRIEHTIDSLTNVSTNMSEARGRIMDADFAAETTALSKAQILQQASTAMLAQANASKQNVLSLLQG